MLEADDTTGTHAPSRSRVPAAPAQRLERLLEAREREIGALVARLALAEEAERRRIAEGLHDEIGHSLAILKMRLAEVRRAASEAALADTMSQLMGIVDAVMRSARTLTFSLSSPVLRQLGLAAAIENLLDRLAEFHDIDVTFEAVGAGGSLPEDSSTLVYRSVLELLLNVAKHAQAGRVGVVLRQGADRIEILVEDDGVGFDVSKLPHRLDAGGGFGLFSIRHGLGHVGGSIEVDSAPGRGTRARLEIPLLR